MVELMGGQFSKPLVANRVTHLICYKFEGESLQTLGEVGNKHLIGVFFFFSQEKSMS